MGWTTQCECKPLAATTRSRSGFIWFFDLQVQGVGDPCHVQVKNLMISCPLQVVGTTESQALWVSEPCSPASGTDLIRLTKQFVFTVLVPLHCSASRRNARTRRAMLCKSSECPDSQGNALQVVGMPGLAEQSPTSHWYEKLRVKRNGSQVAKVKSTPGH